MFGKMMNNYYYGKSGKGDFRREDMPETRMQLFKETLRTRFASLIRLNLLYALIWLPAMFVIFRFCSLLYSSINDINVYSATYQEYTDWTTANNIDAYSEDEFNLRKGEAAVLLRDYDLYKKVYPNTTQEQFAEQCSSESSFLDYVSNLLFKYLAILIPCIAITGPFTAGLSYVTRNWARDEHAFIWADYKDAIKGNWKIPLVISSITSLVPLLVFECWRFYGNLANSNAIMAIPQVIAILCGAFWSISVTYMYPLTVTYDYKLKDVLVNGIKFGEFRLPFSIGIRLLHCVPLVIFFLAQYLFGMDMMMAVIILGVYYILIGFSLSRFITASYTNAVFDRFLNSRIQGAKVNQGLKETDDDDEDDEDEEETDSTADEVSETGKE